MSNHLIHCFNRTLGYTITVATDLYRVDKEHAFGEITVDGEVKLFKVIHRIPLALLNKQALVVNVKSDLTELLTKEFPNKTYHITFY